MRFSEEITSVQKKAEQQIDGALKGIDMLIDENQWKVIDAFQKYKVSDYHFADSTGYGYNDRGREVLDLVYAEVFRAEAALVRPHFASGTHTISTVLFGILRPGDQLLYITGTPYDTLHKVIGNEDVDTGSLRNFGVEYDEVSLLSDGSIHWEGIKEKLTPRTKVIGIQRSKGYDQRPAYTVKQIEEMVRFVKAINPNVITFVDNCYGEFTETIEPTEVGVDIMAGSLIKNPGGSIAPTGGYIVGKKKYVDLAAYRLTAPGIGAEVGAMLGTTRAIFHGLFLAPHLVGQAIKGSIFAASMFEHLGFETMPKWSEERCDLIQAVHFRNAEQLVAFVQGIQKAAAVDSHVVPEPWDMPGYEHPVIMAAGTFIQGGSLELSADAPMREPFVAFMQGGLTYSHCKLGVLTALQNLFDRNLL